MTNIQFTLPRSMFYNSNGGGQFALPNGTFIVDGRLRTAASLGASRYFSWWNTRPAP